MEIDFDGSKPKSQFLDGILSNKSDNNQKDLEEINKKHEELISEILVQEEQLIS